MTQLTQEYLNNALEKQTERLEKKLDEQGESLAQIINSGFQAKHDYMQRRFDEPRDLLKLRDVVAEHDRKIQKISEILQIK